VVHLVIMVIVLMDKLKVFSCFMFKFRSCSWSSWLLFSYNSFLCFTFCNICVFQQIQLNCIIMFITISSCFFFQSNQYLLKIVHYIYIWLFFESSHSFEHHNYAILMSMPEIVILWVQTIPFGSHGYYRLGPHIIVYVLLIRS